MQISFRRRKAFHDSDSTSSDSSSGGDSSDDERRFQRRKAKSMAKARGRSVQQHFRNTKYLVIERFSVQNVKNSMFQIVAHEFHER